MSDLAKITKSLGTAYKKWKGGEKDKNKHKDAFWSAIDEDAANEPEEKLIEVDPFLLTEGTLEEYIEREYPAWTLDESRTREDDWVDAILTLKPEFKAFEYINADDGMVYARQFVNGSPVLDDESLRMELPDLWIKITEVPNRAQLAEVLYNCGVDHEEVEQRIDDLWQGPRTLKLLDSLDPETLSLVQAFVHPGKPSTKLPAPRKARPEELEAVAEDVDPDDDGSGHPDGLE